MKHLEADIRKRLHELIDTTEDSTLLNKALSILSGEDEDALRDYESEAKALEAYEQDLQHGTFAKHSEVMKQFEVWMKG